ncbi:MAG: SpoIIE family protein phosphatase [Bacteroidota bacterium]
MHPTELNIDLRSFPILKDFATEQIEAVLEHATIRHLAPNEILIQPDVPNDTLYLIVEGHLSIVVENEGSEVAFPIGPGECVGEISLVLNRPTSAQAISQGTATVLCIPEKLFWQKVALNKQGIRNLVAMMAGRLRRANYALIEEIEEQLKYKHLAKELETAGKIQSGIVPNGSTLLNHCQEIDAFAFIKQAREVGGDFYDALLLDEEHIYFAIGDVSGKGMPAALFMMRIFTSLRMLINNIPQVDRVISQVNDLLARNNNDMMFVTLFAGILNTRTGKLEFVNAGHNAPFIINKGAKFKALTERNGPLLGVIEKAKFSLGELTLKAGDTLLLYTDGVSEAMNEQNEMYGMDRMETVLNAVRFDTMRSLATKLEQNLDEFVGAADQHDDFTVLGLRYLGAEE